MLSVRLELTRFLNAGALHGGNAGSGTVRMMCPGRGQGRVPPWQNGHGEAPMRQSWPNSWSQGQVGCTGAPATQRPRPHLGSGEASWVSGFQASGAGQRCTVPWMGHVSSVWDGPGGQRPATFSMPLSSFPQGPLSPALSWLSPLRNPLLGNPAFFVCGHAGRMRWCHSSHLAPDRTRDAAFVQGNTDGDFYGGSDRNLRYRFW